MLKYTFLVIILAVSTIFSSPSKAWLSNSSFYNKNLHLFAGKLGGVGNNDGVGTAARFNYPLGIALDSTTGNFYVADSNNRVIRKITSDGTVTIIAGLLGTTGGVDGTGTAARFWYPNSIVIDTTGNLFVLDTYNYAIRKVTTAGVVTTFAGTLGSSGSVDGTGTAAKFGQSFGLAIDTSNNLYLADAGYHTIRKITPSGVVTTLAGTSGSSGSVDGTGTAAKFNYPKSLIVDSSGNVFVFDANNYVIRKVTPSGVVTTFAGTLGSTGSTDGTGTAAKFGNNGGFGIDSSNNIYIMDASYHTIRKMTTGGVVTTIAGAAGIYGVDDGTGAAARFNSPISAIFDSSGNLFIVDQSNQKIRKMTSAGVVTTIAGSGSSFGLVDGTSVAARFSTAEGITKDSSGNFYVADTSNNAIRKITPAGVVTTLAGGSAYGSTDGTGTAAKFNSPYAITIDSAGNLFVADSGNYTIRKVTQAGVVTTFAGTAGASGTTNATGTAARFYYPRGITIDSSNNLYVSDSFNYLIRKITPAGVVTTFVGVAGSATSVDGTGTAARVSGPLGLITDSSNNIYLADGGTTIRKITSAGVVTTIAGTFGSSATTDGTGTAARFTSAKALAIDSANNLYVTDAYARVVRKVSSAGVVTTLVGKPGGTYGVKLGALKTTLNAPGGIITYKNKVFFFDENSLLWLNK